ncbi:MAG: hypothetical protein JWN16_1250 [Alphaproteobacteria bacterium]|nr:hypothetical protein [Alphaproteobacteria bacterium]
MDAPVWMYALSRLAFAQQIPLNAETFKIIAPEIKLFPNVAPFLRKLKDIEKTAVFRKVGVEIHHFIVSAGLKDLVGQILPDGLIRWTFGCCYQINSFEGDPHMPESIPVFCMDETMKTRSLYEISKGSFQDKTKTVNSLVPPEKRWAPFENMIYVGDGFTDVPAFSLVRSLGGLGIAVYNPKKTKADTNKRLERLRLDKRTDLITPANFDTSGELYSYLKSRCMQIAQRYRAAHPI